MYQQQYAALLGHPVCHVTDVDHTNKRFLIFVGPMSWNASKWQAAMNLQHNFMQHYQRRSHGNSAKEDGNITLFWNEIVMALPRPQLQDAVLAVFYLDDNSRDSHDTLLLHRRNERQSTRRFRAHHEARVLGGVPVLRMRRRPNHAVAVGTPLVRMDRPDVSSTPNDDTAMDLLTCDGDDDDDDDDDGEEAEKDGRTPP